MIDNVKQFEPYLEFMSKDEVYLLLIMSRAKDGGTSTQSSERKDPENVKRRIITSVDDYRKHAEDLLRFAEVTWEHYRLYITYNPRSLTKAYFNMTTEFNHTLYFKGHEEWSDKIKKMDIWFRTYLHRPGAKAETRYHVIDVDGEFIPNLPLEIHIHEKFKTPNGWHLLCIPFNPGILGKSYTSAVINGKEFTVITEFKQDAMLNLYAK